jgi:hypothetical protein
MTEVILINKIGQLTNTKIKTMKEEEFYKKCGFKNDLHFGLRHNWKIHINKQHLNVSLYAKNESRLSNIENKYEFPPPVSNELYFGTCLLTCYTIQNNIKTYIHLTLDLWNKIYEKLFGGFEDLSKTALRDELEPDELANVPKHKLTKEGYLKDGFVVDTPVDNSDEDDYVETDDNNSDGGSEWSDIVEDDKKTKINKNLKKQPSIIKPTIITTVFEELKPEPYI